MLSEEWRKKKLKLRRNAAECVASRCSAVLQQSNNMSNQYPSNCDRCDVHVPARAGVLSRAGRRWRVQCPDCAAGAESPGAAAARVSRGNDTSYGVVTSTGWVGFRNRAGRCEDAPCCGCCTF